MSLGMITGVGKRGQIEGEHYTGSIGKKHR